MIQAPQALSARELDALLRLPSVGDHRSALRSRDHLLLHFLLGTGMRISEALGVRLSDIDLPARRIFVRPTRAKGGKGRYIYISPALVERISGYLSDPPPFYERQLSACEGPSPSIPLFTTREGTAIHPAHVRGLMKKIARRAGVEPERVHAHAFRHTYAIRFLDAGGSLAALRDQLGHSRIDTTAVYLLASSRTLEEFTRGLPF